MSLRLLVLKRALPALLLLVATGVALSMAFAFAPSISDIFDPSKADCEARAQLLPRQIPAAIILNVTDDTGNRFGAEIQPRVARELNAAISRFPFAEAIRFQFNDSKFARENGSYEIDYQIWIMKDLLQGVKAQGMMCGNSIIVDAGENEQENIWTHTHELGHFFGLPHHDRTIMNDDGDRRYANFSACQNMILSQWYPDLKYEPHWARLGRGECTYNQDRLEQFFDELIGPNHAI